MKINQISLFVNDLEKKKKTIIYLFFIALAISGLDAGVARAQTKVVYFSEIPVIDGLLDEQFSVYPVNNLNIIEKSDPSNQDVKVAYFSAYNSKYLYLYIEAESDSIVVRDRGYQNGDGFIIMIGKPQENMLPTDEFYILGFSAGDNTRYRKIYWYYNIDLGSFADLGDDVAFSLAVHNGKSSFELLLPWYKVYPYHPLLSNSIGFNLCFVKAIGSNENNNYFLKSDPKIQNEQSKREYSILQFTPDNSDHPRYAAMLSENHTTEGNSVSVQIAKQFPEATDDKFSIMLYSGENERIMSKELNARFDSGLCKKNANLDIKNLPCGGYKIVVLHDKTEIAEQYLTILPEFKPTVLKKIISDDNTSLTEGSKNTLNFYIDDIADQLTTLKPYEHSFTLRKKISDLNRYFEALKSDTDLLAAKKGTYRRAYLSKNDGKLYPYSIHIPEDYSPDKKYPLLVYLHGSGQDDRALNTSSAFIPTDFITMAPNGRNVSNCYATEEAQLDIRNSIADVIKNFTIDTANIILSGFSMGGYGVYRTFYENPNPYKAIAVISGHPNLAAQWLGDSQLNFLDRANLKGFNKIPIFIYHGENDLNTPYELTLKLVNLLKTKNNNVVFKTNKSGHGGMDATIRKEYLEWLTKQVKDYYKKY